MLRLLTIEWLKLKSFRMFWVVLIAYALIIALVIKQASELKLDLPITQLEALQYPDVWHIISWAANTLNILLAAVIIFYVCDEFRNHTVRKQIIDGMTEAEFVIGKMFIVIGLAIFSTLVLFVIGLIFGVKPPGSDSSIMWEKIHYLGLHFLSLLTYMSLGMLLGMLLKRAIPALMVFILLHIVEFIFVRSIGGSLIELLPLHAMDDMIQVPFLAGKVLEPAKNSIVVISVAVAFYFILANILSWYKLKRSSL